MIAGLATACAASQGIAAPTATTPAPDKIEVFKQIEAVAGQICKSPEMFGSTRAVDGQLSGRLKVSTQLR
ncbi:hypothetical protein [Phenylobacterium sp.]|jgi:hypothetical protein|uniref:hypothetical protein n=1 Tax=Phenylobacterium sp. TaxID=1871053 RepID=UPI002E372981|nr:hypothetical protein [Phenylobacterium sp.]HEX3364651.1 hypothetical protein [Phenylobacterium sp.]